MAIDSNAATTLAVTTNDDAIIDKARAIAEQLHLPFVEDGADLPWALILSTDQLALRFPGAKNPFVVNFLQSSYERRLQQASRNKEPLARAIGLKFGVACHVLDGTAGWGSDAVLLAKLGARVTAIERSPVVAALLADGVRRLKKKACYTTLDIQIEVADTQEYIKKNDIPLPDVIYLDPMFPERPNNAQVKKSMQLLQLLIGTSPDVELLAKTAFTVCPRLVIKRPEWAQPIMKNPTYSIPAGIVRFDVYIRTK